MVIISQLVKRVNYFYYSNQDAHSIEPTKLDHKLVPWNTHFNIGLWILRFNLNVKHAVLVIVSFYISKSHTLSNYFYYQQIKLTGALFWESINHYYQGSLSRRSNAAWPSSTLCACWAWLCYCYDWSETAIFSPISSPIMPASSRISSMRRRSCSEPLTLLMMSNEPLPSSFSYRHKGQVGSRDLQSSMHSPQNAW